MINFLQKLPAYAMAMSGVLFAAFAVEGQSSEAAQSVSVDASQIIQAWPETSKKAANAMIEKYGQPDEATENLLIWRDNGPWVRTIVYGYEVDHKFPMPHKDVLEQFIHYDVPVEMFDDIAQYDGSVIAERTKGELSARCDKEAANFLAINLANDVIEGKKSVSEARQAYAEAIRKMMEGSPPENMKGFTFKPARSDVNDTDVVMLNE